MAGEQKLQKQCVAYAALRGCFTRKIRYEGRRNAPDLFVALPCGDTVFFEVKNPNKKGSISKGQRDEIELMRSVGLRVYIVDNLEDFTSIIDNIIDA